MADIPRPSHADYTYQAKYGVRASSGGGRASARETIGRVAAGAIAEKWLTDRYPNLSIVAWVSSVGTIDAPRSLEEVEPPITRDQVDANIVRCPDETTADKMQKCIEQALSEQDSLGGVVTCVVNGMPVGLGEPVFDKLEAMMAHAMLSIPSTKGFEIGSGFEGAKMRGSAHNDMFVATASSSSSGPVSSPSPSPNPSPSSPLLANTHAFTLRTATNRSGGIQGGISNGEPLVMRIAFKPPATIGVAQGTVDFEGSASVLRAQGRHDPCVLPRAIPIVEAMAALVLADCAMIQLAREAATMQYPVMGKIKPPTKPVEQQQAEAPKE